MPEATTLYVMSSIAVVGLAAWVAYVLATVKTQWARGPLPATAGVPAAPLAAEGDAMTTGAHLPLAEVDPSVDADDTARATPVALSEGKARVSRPE